MIMMSEKADIGLIGLAVMGQNLVLNMNDHGYVVCVFNRTQEKVEAFLKNEARGTKVIGATTIEDLVGKLKKPRKVMIMVKAGSATDAVIDQLKGFLEEGDVIIDGGNADYHDTMRRYKELTNREKGKLLFVGTGVSGGEEGARYGPSIMPGGSKEAWPLLKGIFQSIAAKVGNEPCCDWVGDSGAGSFVKMVHNGIEYGDMQLIAEAYHVLKDAVGVKEEQLSQIFKEWNRGELSSFLIEITQNILAFKDNDGKYLLPKILDSAGQKGTGRWTAISALEFGMPLTLIGEAVFARSLSTLVQDRKLASHKLPGPSIQPLGGDHTQIIEDVRQALYASKIVSYAQGFMLLEEAAKEYNWDLNFGSIALMWRGGCIIRSAFLGNIKEAFDKKPRPSNLLLDDFFSGALKRCQESWRHVVSTAVLHGVPTPAFSSALAFYDGYRSSQLPANLIQAQRDYFGAHTYQLSADPERFVHTNWTGKGGNVTSGSYQA